MPKRLIAPAYLIASTGVMASIAHCTKPSKCEPLYKRFDPIVYKNEHLDYRIKSIPTHPTNTIYLKYFNYCTNEFKNNHALLLTIYDATKYTSVEKECHLYAKSHYLNDTDPEFKQFYSGMHLMWK